MTIISNVIEDTFQTIASPFVDIWNFALYNIISPILLILFVILFFIGQYYLIKLYIKLFQWVFGNLFKLIDLILESKKIKSIIEKLI